MRFSLVTALILTGCSNTSLQQGKARIASENANPVVQQQNNRDDEVKSSHGHRDEPPPEEKAAAPSNVTGGFLHCLTQDEDHPSNIVLGCRITKDGQRIPVKSIAGSASYEFTPTSVEGVDISVQTLTDDPQFEALYTFSAASKDLSLEAALKTRISFVLKELLSGEPDFTYSNLGSELITALPKQDVHPDVAPQAEAPLPEPEVPDIIENLPIPSLPKADPLADTWQRERRSDKNSDGACSADEDCIFIDPTNNLAWAAVSISRSFSGAGDFCQGLSYGGHDNWYAPKAGEIEDAAGAGIFVQSALKTDAFAGYWTEDEVEGSNSRARSYSVANKRLESTSKADVLGVICHRHPD